MMTVTESLIRQVTICTFDNLSGAEKLDYGLAVEHCHVCACVCCSQQMLFGSEAKRT